MLGGMQDWPLRVMRILDHAEREHGTREIVSLESGGKTRSNWAGVARDARTLGGTLPASEIHKRRYGAAFERYERECHPIEIADAVVFNDA